jgi:hypothetical protein
MTNTPPIDDVKLGEMTRIALAEDNDHMIATAANLPWLIAQLACWPTRVDQDCTTNMRFLMMSAAATLLARTPPHADTLSLPTRDTVILQPGKRAEALFDLLRHMSDSEFAEVAAGDDGEELLGRIVGVLGDLVAGLHHVPDPRSTPPESMSTGQGEAELVERILDILGKHIVGQPWPHDDEHYQIVGFDQAARELAELFGR